MEMVLAILLWILKAVGILIGGLLLLLLFLLLLIVCVPIRYQVDLQKQTAFLYGGRVSWLFRFLQFIYRRTETETLTEIRVCGFPLKREAVPLEPKADQSEKVFQDLEEDLWESDWQNMEEEEFKEKLYKYFIQETENNRETSNENNNENNNPYLPQPDVDRGLMAAEILPTKPENLKERNLPEKASVNSRSEVTTDKILSVEEKLQQEDMQTVGDWLKEEEARKPDIWDEFDDISEQEWDAESSSFRKQTRKSNGREKLDFGWLIFSEIREYFQKNKGVIGHILYWIFRIIRSVLPKRLDGIIHFGLNDPSHTGYVLAIFYLFYPEKRGKMLIQPDFEKFIICGEVKISGRIILILLLYYVLRIILDIRIFRFIKFILKVRKQIKNRAENLDKDMEDLSASAEA